MCNHNIVWCLFYAHLLQKLWTYKVLIAIYTFFEKDFQSKYREKVTIMVDTFAFLYVLRSHEIAQDALQAKCEKLTSILWLVFFNRGRTAVKHASSVQWYAVGHRTTSQTWQLLFLVFNSHKSIKRIFQIQVDRISSVCHVATKSS